MGYPNSWMVYNVKSQTKIDDLGVPLFQETSIRLEESLSWKLSPEKYPATRQRSEVDLVRKVCTWGGVHCREMANAQTIKRL